MSRRARAGGARARGRAPGAVGAAARTLDRRERLLRGRGFRRLLVEDERVLRDVAEVALRLLPLSVEARAVKLGLALQDALHDRLVLARDAVVLLLADRHVERDRLVLRRLVRRLRVHDRVHLPQQDLVLALDRQVALLLHLHALRVVLEELGLLRPLHVDARLHVPQLLHVHPLRAVELAQRRRLVAHAHVLHAHRHRVRALPRRRRVAELGRGGAGAGRHREGGEEGAGGQQRTRQLEIRARARGARRRRPRREEEWCTLLSNELDNFDPRARALPPRGAAGGLPSPAASRCSLKST